MSERLRQPLTDWHETRRTALERAAREARTVHRQQQQVQVKQEAEDEEKEEKLPSIEGCASFCPLPLSLSIRLELSQRALHALAELQHYEQDVARGRVSIRRDAEWFQLKLAALVALTGGGVLRPGSVVGIFLDSGGLPLDEQVAAIRRGGYEGPLTHASGAGPLLVLRLLAFKNQGAREAEQRRLGGFRYVLPPVVSGLVRFFSHQLRGLLEPRGAIPSSSCSRRAATRAAGSTRRRTALAPCVAGSAACSSAAASA